MITLRRTYYREYTCGKLYIDGKFICHTRECPKESELPYKCIPEGTYTIDMTTYSPRFSKTSWAKYGGGKVPLVVGPHRRVGIRIHVGNFASGDKRSETQGCILVGDSLTNSAQLSNSIVAYKRVIDNLKSDSKHIFVITRDD